MVSCGWQGTRTCFACQQAIAGPAIRVASLGRLYHPQHFRCAGCTTQLSPACFFLSPAGLLHCSECEDIPPPTDRRPPAAAAAAAPTCTTTATSSPSNGGGVVVHHLHRPTTAGGGPVPVFECQRCGGEVPGGRMFSVDGRPMCGACYAGQPPGPSGPSVLASSSLSCGNCGQQIAEGSFLRALGKIWHGHCFACAQCATPLLNDHFFEKQGRPYCSRHKW